MRNEFSSQQSETRRVRRDVAQAEVHEQLAAHQARMQQHRTDALIGALAREVRALRRKVAGDPKD